MKKQIKTLTLNKATISGLSAENLSEIKGGKSGINADCPTLPLCETVSPPCDTKKRCLSDICVTVACGF